MKRQSRVQIIFGGNGRRKGGQCYEYLGWIMGGAKPITMQIAYIPFGASAPLRTYFRVPHRERMAPRGYILYRSLSDGLRMWMEEQWKGERKNRTAKPCPNQIWTQRTKEKEGEVNKYFSLISLNSLSVLLYLSYVHDRKIVQKDNKQYSPRMVLVSVANAQNR